MNELNKQTEVSMTRQGKLSVKCVENILAVIIDKGDIRNMCFRRNSLKRKTGENKKSIELVSHYVTVLIF